MANVIDVKTLSQEKQYPLLADILNCNIELNLKIDLKLKYVFYRRSTPIEL